LIWKICYNLSNSTASISDQSNDVQFKVTNIEDMYWYLSLALCSFAVYTTFTSSHLGEEDDGDGDASLWTLDVPGCDCDVVGCDEFIECDVVPAFVAIVGPEFVGAFRLGIGGGGGEVVEVPDPSDEDGVEAAEEEEAILILFSSVFISFGKTITTALFRAQIKWTTNLSNDKLLCFVCAKRSLF